MKTSFTILILLLYFTSFGQSNISTSVTGNDSVTWNMIKDKPTLTTGTVTSVGLSAPSIFEVTGTPVTTAGTLGLSLADQSAYTVFAVGSSAGAPATTNKLSSRKVYFLQSDGTYWWLLNPDI